jgi:hypothetical protein
MVAAIHNRQAQRLPYNSILMLGLICCCRASASLAMLVESHFTSNG